MFLGDLTHHIDNDYNRSSQRDRMSTPPLSLPPATVRPIPRQQRTEDILQPLDINISPPSSLPQSEIPFIEPFNFLYGDSIIGRGERPRSTSPVSVDRLPPLRHVASVVLPVPVPFSVPGPRRRRRRVREEGEGGQERRLLRPISTPDAERLLSMKRIKRDIGVMKRPQIQDLQTEQQQIQQQQHYQRQQQQVQQPPRQVVLRSALKPSNPNPQVSVNYSLLIPKTMVFHYFC